MKYTKNSIISEAVADNYKTAAVFKNYKIDFCCNGNKSILEASNKKEFDVDEVVTKLNNLSLTPESTADYYNDWPVDLLAEYIQRMHHTYVEEKLPLIRAFLDKIQKVHGEAHPELYEIYDLFEGACTDLTAHMRKEEEILFPFAKAVGKNDDETMIASEKVEEYMAEMHKEHNHEGDRFRKIRMLSNDYQPPADACTTYKVAYAMLEDFEDNLHKHVHLENNILCPKLLKTFEFQT